MSQLTITIDERIRLVTAVLAASAWPAQEQAQKTHAVHPHARQTQHFVRPFAHHPAVQQTNQLLAAGAMPVDFCSAALRCSWPDFAVVEPLPPVEGIAAWAAALPAFERQAQLAARHWSAYQAVWQEAVDDLRRIFSPVELTPLLQQISGGALPPQVWLMPALVAPMLAPLLATASNAWLLLLPPPKAVGESPPWPYLEDPPWVVTQVCEQLLTHTLAVPLAAVDSQQGETWMKAAVSLCLSCVFDEMEAIAYILRSKKEKNLPQLPAAAERLQAALDPSGTPVEWRSIVE